MKYDLTLEILCYRDFKNIEASDPEAAELIALKMFRDSIKEDKHLYFDEDEIFGKNFKEHK